jgi:hypothetical protein
MLPGSRQTVKKCRLARVGIADQGDRNLFFLHNPGPPDSYKSLIPTTPLNSLISIRNGGLCRSPLTTTIFFVFIRYLLYHYFMSDAAAQTESRSTDIDNNRPGATTPKTIT